MTRPCVAEKSHRQNSFRRSDLDPLSAPNRPSFGKGRVVNAEPRGRLDRLRTRGKWNAVQGHRVRCHRRAQRPAVHGTASGESRRCCSRQLLRFHARALSAHALPVRRSQPHSTAAETAAGSGAIAARMQPRSEPTGRTIVGILLILLLIVGWAALVASLSRIVGAWSVILQAPYYLVMGLAWIVPLKPLIRWMQTGSFRSPR